MEESDNLLSKNPAFEDSQLAYRSQRMKAMEYLLYNKEKSAAAIYGIFEPGFDNDAKYFDILATILNSVYDSFSFVAYFFFLKAKDRYAPVRRDADTAALKKLDADASCMNKCTWKNYMAFMSVINDIYAFLSGKTNDVELIDAQSFLWMMWMVDTHNTPEYIESDDPYETSTYTSSYFEGKKLKVYGTKYERDKRVRTEFLKGQVKPYSCEACGMDFQSIYGDLGKDVIDVHHKKPLYVDGVEQEIKPTSEYLACLCPNCHRMIHRRTSKGQIMTVDQLKKIILKN